MKATVENFREVRNLRTWRVYASSISSKGNNKRRLYLEWKGKNKVRVTLNDEILYKGTCEVVAVNIFNENDF